jgi:hypothetical protein
MASNVRWWIAFSLACASWAGAVAAQTYSGSNGVYDVFVDGTGEYTARTGPLHPTPGLNVFYDGSFGAPGTTWNSVRSYDSSTEYVLFDTFFFPPTASAGFNCDDINNFAPTTTLIGTTGVRTRWRIQNGVDDLTVVQEVNAEGVAFADSVVRVTLCLTNNRSVTARTGIRFQWDWEIAGNDGPWIGLRPPYPPAEPFIGTERLLVPGAIDFYDVSDSEWPSIIPSTYRVGGTVTGPILSQGPVRPDKLQYAYWPSIVNTCFDYTTSAQQAGDDDSAVAYYWGPTAANAIVLAPGQSYCATQYVFVFTNNPPPLCQLTAAPARGRRSRWMPPAPRRRIVPGSRSSTGSRILAAGLRRTGRPTPPSTRARREAGSSTCAARRIPRASRQPTRT